MPFKENVEVSTTTHPTRGIAKKPTCNKTDTTKSIALISGFVIFLTINNNRAIKPTIPTETYAKIIFKFSVNVISSALIV